MENNVTVEYNYEGMGRHISLKVDGITIWVHSGAMDHPLGPEGQALLNAIEGYVATEVKGKLNG